MAVKKKTEPVTDKRRRLERTREQIKKFDTWFHPSPDEIENILYLASEWAALDISRWSEKDLARAQDNSVFERIIHFCKNEINDLVKKLENRTLSGEGTAQNNIRMLKYIQTLKQLFQADDLETVEELYLRLEDMNAYTMLARIMHTSYWALRDPSVLDDLSLAKLRSDLLEVVANAYADINQVMRQPAAKGIKQGIDQAKNTIKARKTVCKLTDEDIAKMKARALELKTKHDGWCVSEFARQLHNEFPTVAVSTIRRYDWLIKLAEPLV